MREMSVVMPCLNEAHSIGACIEKAKRAISQLGVSGEIIVSDNGSTDGSAEIAAEAGARVVHCARRGYGAAIKYGVAASSGDIIVIGDADDTYDFSGIAPFVDKLKEGQDMVIGNRFRGRIFPGAMPWLNRWVGNPVLTAILNLLFRSGIGDAHCGLRAVTRQAYDKMLLESDGMEFASEMVVKAAKLRFHISEVPIQYYPDHRERRSNLRPWRDGWRHLKYLLMFSPLHLFIIPGACGFALGVLLIGSLTGGPLTFGRAHLDVHWMTLGGLLTILGAQVLQFGISARLFTVSYRFPEPDHLAERLGKYLKVEFLLGGGLAVFLIGFVIDILILVEWINVRFGELDRIRPAILAMTLMVLGIQILFFGFFLGIIGEPLTHSTSDENIA